MFTFAPILPDEKELFMRMSNGDEAAFTRIFYHYAPRVYHYILNKTKSSETTEEIVQELFIKIWQSRENFAEVSNYESYLSSMASNKLIDFFRKMSQQEKLKKQVWQVISSVSNNTIEQLDLRHCQELISEAVEQLSPQRKKIFIMNKRQGFTRQEIAKQLNLSVHTVNHHLNDAVKFVKEYLEATPDALIALLLFICCSEFPFATLLF